MLFKNIHMLFCAITLTLAFAPATFSQSFYTDDNHPEMEQNLSINESNLYCFRNLQCLIQENPFRNSSLKDINLNNATKKYVIEGKTRNEELYAEYNGTTGNLIRSTVIQTDIILPMPILEKLVSDEFKDWTMAANKRIIKNFAKDTIRYEVILMKDDKIRVEYFNQYGAAENRLS